MNHATTGLPDRLTALERGSRRLLIGTGALCLGLVGLTVEGTDLVRNRDDVEARRFVLRDDQGQVRAVLGLNAEQVPSLTFFDDSGRAQMTLNATSDSATGLYLYDEGDLKVALTSPGEGSAALRFLEGGTTVSPGLSPASTPTAPASAPRSPARRVAAPRVVGMPASTREQALSVEPIRRSFRRVGPQLIAEP